MKKRMDNLLYYEVYNERGELVTEGDVVAIAENLDESIKHVRHAVRKGKCKGLEYVLVGKLRRVFDCHEGAQYITTGMYEGAQYITTGMYEGAQYITTGMYEENAERTSNALTTVKYGSNPSPHEATGERQKQICCYCMNMKIER